MKRKTSCVIVLFICLSFCCKRTIFNQAQDKTETDLDKNKLMALLDEVLVDDKLGGYMKDMQVDISEYKRNSDLIYEGNGRWSFGIWSIFKKSTNEYEMVAAEGSMRIHIDFETGEKYKVKDWDLELITREQIQ
ncbi:MAG TPA: hypothetical protein VM658_14390 [bacterium]|nr:hypothetical protein [bacterium]